MDTEIPSDDLRILRNALKAYRDQLSRNLAQLPDETTAEWLRMEEVKVAEIQQRIHDYGS